jgi:hypothetical protein
LPLVGFAGPDDRVCYLCGCNAWGQASLSYAVALVPGILGFEALTGERREAAELLDIKRFVGLRAARL